MGSAPPEPLVAPIPTRRRLRRLLGRLDAAAFAAFVADLWTARGWETRVTDGVVEATHPERGDRVTLLVRHDPGWLGRWLPLAGAGASADPDSVTAVVTSGPDRRALRAEAFERDARLVDVGDLHGMLRYAVDDGARRRLFETHFGATPAALAGESVGGRIEGGLRTIGGGGRSLVPVAVAVVVVLLVSAAAAAPLLGPALGPTIAGEEPRTTADSGPAATTATTPEPTATTATTATRTELRGSLPPGMDAGGITDAEALARAHRDALRYRSYRMVLFESYSSIERNGSDVAFHRSTGRIETIKQNGTIYRIRTERRHEGGPEQVRRTSLYADGTDKYSYVRDGDGPTYRRLSLDAPPRPLDGGSYVDTYLDPDRSTIVRTATNGTTTLYTVVVDEPPSVGYEIRDYHAVAVVDGTGIVRSLYVEFTGASGVPTTVVMRYERIGGVEVTPPDWYGTARNRTAPNGTTTADGVDGADGAG